MFRNEHNKQLFNDWLPILFIFILLLSIFLLTYSGVPISDDEHLFAAVSQNLVLSGEFRADQLLGNQRVLGRYRNVGPIHPIVGSIVFRLVRWTNKIGAVQALYFLSPIYTALTGALIFGYGVLRKYSRRASLIASLAFGLSTIAWPYTQTFYRETLAMLLFFSSFFVFTTLLEDKLSKKYQAFGWFLFCGLFFLAILVKIYFILLIPLFIIRLWSKRSVFLKNKPGNIFRLILILLVVVVFVGILWQVSSFNQFSRLPSLFQAVSIERIPGNYQRFFSFETIKHLIAVFFSPSKGLFVYSPVLIISLISVSSRKGRARENLVVPLGALAMFISVQLFLYQANWWNISWSTRFLLPIIPVLITAGLPIIDSVLASENKFYLGLLCAALGLGFVIQIGGTAVSDSVYLEYLYSQQKIADLAETIWSYHLMPAIQHWKLLFSGQPLHYAAVRNFVVFPTFISVILLILISIISWSGNNLFLLFQERRAGNSQPSKQPAIWIILYLLIFLPALMLIAYRTDPYYFPLFSNLDTAAVFLSNETDQDDLIIVDGYQKPAWYHMMNFGRTPTTWYALPEQTADWQSAVERIFRLEGSIESIWVLIEYYENNEQLMLEYFCEGGFTCQNVPFTTANSDAHFRIMNCISTTEE